MKETLLENKTKEAIWFPTEEKKEIALQAEKEGLTTWVYLWRFHKKYVASRMKIKK
jgi:hypothetical protein